MGVLIALSPTPFREGGFLCQRLKNSITVAANANAEQAVTIPIFPKLLHHSDAPAFNLALNSPPASDTFCRI